MPSSIIPLFEGDTLAKKYGLHQIIIIGRVVGDDGYENVLTHGTNMEHSAVASMTGDYIKTEIMKWDSEDDGGEVGKRVKLARAAPGFLKALETIRRFPHASWCPKSKPEISLSDCNCHVSIAQGAIAACEKNS